MQKTKEIVLSPFIMFDSNTGEAIWYECPACPRCGFKMGGRMAGVFKCEICGFSEVPKYSDCHGYHLCREGLWRFLHLFLKHTSKQVVERISQLLYAVWWRWDALEYDRFVSEDKKETR